MTNIKAQVQINVKTQNFKQIDSLSLPFDLAFALWNLTFINRICALYRDI